VRDPADKVMAWEAARAWRERLRPSRLVFTNGVFDILHPGHVGVLAAARAAGDALIVGINSDASTRRLKGPERPVRTETARAHMLAALEAVDAVTIFHQDTPLELIRHLRPDILVKGGDYSADSVVGGDDVRGWGGSVVIVPLTPGHSTTSLIGQLRDSNHGTAE
jgi:rfaE bifunctional protein nucleotidyltransferase chain/domain